MPNAPKNSDILFTKDFRFEPYKQSRKDDGFSGKLLLAASRANESVQYIIKHSIIADACNEYMYHKVASIVGLPTPSVKLMDVSPEDMGDFNYKNRYMAAIQYLPNARFYNIDNDSKDSQNSLYYYAFRALIGLLGDVDNPEFITDEYGTLFKIDNAEAFAVSNLTIETLELDQYQKTDTTEFMLNTFLHHPATVSRYNNLVSLYNITIGEYGSVAFDSFVECVERFSDFNGNLLDDAIQTLDYFYDKRLGEYYRQYIQTTKNDCKKFLEVLKDAQGKRSI